MFDAPGRGNRCVDPDPFTCVNGLELFPIWEGRMNGLCVPCGGVGPRGLPDMSIMSSFCALLHLFSEQILRFMRYSTFSVSNFFALRYSTCSSEHFLQRITSDSTLLQWSLKRRVCGTQLVVIEVRLKYN